MAQVSLSDLRARARELAGQESSAVTSAFVDDAELSKIVNEALSGFHDLMVEVQRHEWVLTPVRTWPTTTVTGQTTYLLPDDLLATSLVRMSNGSDQFRVPSWEHAERPGLISASALPYIDGYYYRVTGRNLELLPEPRQSYTLYVDYVPEFAPLSHELDETVDIPYGWWLWPCLKAAISMKHKGNTDASDRMNEWVAEDRRIRALAGRHGSRGLRISNTRRNRANNLRYPRLWRDT